MANDYHQPGATESLPDKHDEVGGREDAQCRTVLGDPGPDLPA